MFSTVETSGGEECVNNQSILKQIVALTKMSGQELRDRYSQLFGQEPPIMNKPYMQRKLAYRLQELDQKRSLSEKAAAQMRMLLQDSGLDPDTGLAAKGLRGRDGRTVQTAPGAVIQRDFRGQTYSVTALRHGEWEFQGKTYRSLSRIAREITGTQKSGPEFFGLASAKDQRTARKLK